MLNRKSEGARASRSLEADRPSIEAAISILADELGADAVLELLQTFLADSPRHLDQLESEAKGSDQATLRRSAHSLKGSAALFGAVELEAGCRRLEDMAAEGRRDGQREQAEHGRSVFEATRRVLDEVAERFVPA
jgi:HPt (histidine-containing phosphotransfer) domain-containing protein